MGLDIALGVVVLLAALRGWFKGFVLQAIQLASLVGCVYLADPVRDLARPYAQDYLPAIEIGILDKLLWWTSAVLTYVLTTGIAVSMVRLARRKPEPDPDLHRGDRGLGFLLGAAKGVLVALFLAWGLSTHAPRYIQTGGWAGEQVQTSQALKLSAEYRPAERIWRSTPVQQFVTRIRERGFSETGSPRGSRSPEESARIETARPVEAPVSPPERIASRPRPLKIPEPATPDPRSERFLEEFDRALRESGLPPEPLKGRQSD